MRSSCTLNSDRVRSSWATPGRRPELLGQNSSSGMSAVSGAGFSARANGRRISGDAVGPSAPEVHYHPPCSAPAAASVPTVSAADTAATETGQRVAAARIRQQLVWWHETKQNRVRTEAELELLQRIRATTDGTCRGQTSRRGTGRTRAPADLPATPNDHPPHDGNRLSCGKLARKPTRDGAQRFADWLQRCRGQGRFQQLPLSQRRQGVQPLNQPQVSHGALGRVKCVTSLPPIMMTTTCGFRGGLG